MNLNRLTMTLPSLSEAYARGLNPREVWREFRRRLAEWDDPALFLSLAGEADLEPLFQRLDAADRSSLPLFGVPFAVKDNIDWQALPTTAACPAFSYRPEASAPVVEALIAAGAFPVGKANLDQFATGLVGTRSPFGTPRNAVVPDRIPGGSSSGSASAVAAGLVAFSLGTDTAGSGRVPAGFQALVGWKPSRGLVSTRGVVPACRTLDCVSVFARSVADAASVARVVSVFDALDPYARPAALSRTTVPLRPRLGVPRQPLGGADAGYARAWEAARHWAARGADVVEFDASPFLEAARLLYEGPWVAERLVTVQPLWDTPEAFHPVTRQVLQTGAGRDAAGAFRAFYRLEGLKRQAEALWNEFDLLLFPTAPALPALAEVEADPVGVNSLLGTWTNFLNLFDLAGLALPAPACADGRPFGVTLVGPSGCDAALFEAGRQLQGEGFGSRSLGPTVLAVAGAHLRGLPLNGQLLERGARFVGEAASAPRYGLYAFQDGKLEKPGMVRSETGGISVPLELWDLPEAGWASFLSLIPHPLGLGKVELDDGRWVTGFLMEGVRTSSSRDISSFGGWRKYVASKA